ncbi:MAG: SLC13 family permease [Gemmatimonadetes bacterium]|nr:SLC13 family permease [Gemmatimonadota bacterium]
MSADAWITLLVLLVTVGLLVRDRVAPALIVLGADVFLLLADVIDAPTALVGFSNPAPFTVAALFVMARAVEKTGGLQPLVSGLMGRGGRQGMGRLLLPVAGASAFLNNTPIVAMIAPQVRAWAERSGTSPSRYLMPLSFAAILGGLVTLIGTSTNIVVSGLMTAHGLEGMGMFEIGRVGLPVALAGLAYLVLFSHRVIPERLGGTRQFEESLREFVVNMRVQRGGPADGRTVEEAGLRNLRGVFLAEVRRGDEVIAPATPDTSLKGGDELVFVGRADDVLDLESRPGLVSAERSHAEPFHDAGHTYFEAVVGSASPLSGKTLREADFRGTYGAAVLAIHRAGERVRAKLGTVRLRPGDTLLLLADEAFDDRWRDRSDFLLVSTFGGLAPASRRQAWGAVGLLVGVVVSAALGLLTILEASMAGALGTVLLRILSPVEARRAVDLDVILLIAASFGLAGAMEASGLAASLAAGIVGSFGDWGVVGALAGVTLATVLLTELITNNAAAVLVFPIALATASGFDADPRAFAFAVAVAASASFLTPIGYQTNTMVYGLGGYRFTDYFRVGLPLTLLVIAAVVVGVPLAWAL